MVRNLETEFDLLKKEVNELKNLLNEKFLSTNLQQEKDKSVKFMNKNDDAGYQFDTTVLNSLMEDMKEKCEQGGIIGAIATVGYFDAGKEAGGDYSLWYSGTPNANWLLSLIEDRTVEKVLRCIGNSDRLNLLLSLLKQPNTVAGLVENCGYTSPGQAYHHLRPLIAADLVIEDKKHAVKGTYIVQPHRVQGIIILLEGIYYLTNTRFSKGNWDEANNACGDVMN